MESATIRTPPSLVKAVFCFPSERNIPKGPEYEKYQHYIDAQGEVLPNSHRSNDKNSSRKKLRRTKLTVNIKLGVQ